MPTFMFCWVISTCLFWRTKKWFIAAGSPTKLFLVPTQQNSMLTFTGRINNSVLLTAASGRNWELQSWCVLMEVSHCAGQGGGGGCVPLSRPRSFTYLIWHWDFNLKCRKKNLLFTKYKVHEPNIMFQILLPIWRWERQVSSDGEELAVGSASLPHALHSGETGLRTPLGPRCCRATDASEAGIRTLLSDRGSQLGGSEESGPLFICLLFQDKNNYCIFWNSGLL